ncbi:hypothetical protein [Paraburkholderia dinghuensis]|uniref:Uncharacterized protein n=1 Tax=Paraburkholderia dinghuensis TaxID=2305225 RepID=A0A3N6MHS6_9BURK|nr:hypothetical protein [Paraburkholderia dinghuensis]RQH02728.1 hypothetical protein D1Y85_21585 [Paraburkholderia dinghuensis]
MTLSQTKTPRLCGVFLFVCVLNICDLIHISGSMCRMLTAQRLTILAVLNVLFAFLGQNGSMFENGMAIFAPVFTQEKFSLSEFFLCGTNNNNNNLIIVKLI